MDSLRLWTVKQLKEHQFDGDFFLLDVRKINDWKKGHIEGAHHLYIGEVPERLSEIPQGIPVVVYCDSGNKSTVVCSFSKKWLNDVISVLGSITAWKKQVILLKAEPISENRGILDFMNFNIVCGYKFRGLVEICHYKLKMNCKLKK